MSYVYFIGIAGISMSGLAQILKHNGWKVAGSDRDESDMVHELRSCGIPVSIGHSPDDLTPDIDLVVYTAAISEDNPQLLRAKEMGLNIITRAQLLGKIMSEYKQSITVCGTHGKTTTTSMLACILMAYTSPTISVGGILTNTGSNVHIGDSEYFVAEACEYTNSFLSFFPKYNIVLNIEEDHPDFFKDLDDIRHSFHEFAKNTQDSGTIFINSEIDNIEEIVKGCKAKTFLFGFDDKCDIYAEDIAHENGIYNFIPVYKGKKYERIHLAVPGKVNVSNALGAIGLCLTMGVPMEAIQKGLLSFTGAQRRFQKKGEYNGAMIIDDYAHHPTEIKATISAAREMSPNRLIVYFQPHTYSRLEALFDDFVEALSKADILLIAEVYAAREQNVHNISADSLASALENKGIDAHFFTSMENGYQYLKKNLMNGDMLISMGAGNIYTVADLLVKE